MKSIRVTCPVEAKEHIDELIPHVRHALNQPTSEKDHPWNWDEDIDNATQSIEISILCEGSEDVLIDIAEQLNEEFKQIDERIKVEAFLLTKKKVF